MTDELLLELIENINEINSTQQITIANRCIELLKIKIDDADPFRIQRNYKEKDYYIKLIVQETEKRLTEEQLQLFYSSLKNYYLSFVTNEEVKKQLFNKLIDQNNILDYNGNFSYSAFEILNRINDKDYVIDIITKYEDILLDDDLFLIDLLCNLKDDNYKLKYINRFIEEPSDLVRLIYSLDDDSLIEKYLEIYKEELDGYIKEHEYVSSLKSDEKKVEYILKNNSQTTLRELTVLNSINNESNLEQLFDYVNNDMKICIIYKFKDENKRMCYLAKLNSVLNINEKLKYKNVLTEIVDDLSDDNLMYVLNNFKNIRCKSEKMFKYRTDENIILEILKSYPSKIAMRRVRTKKLISTDLIMSNIDMFLEFEEVENKEKVKEILQYMYSTNNDIVSNVVWEIIDDKYINIFGLDKLNVIASLNNLSSAILEMNNRQLVLLNKCLDEYLKKYDTDEWNIVCERMIATIHFQNVDKKDITSIIDDFDKVNIGCLLNILLNGDEVGITSIDDINNYFELLAQKCDEQIKDSNIFLKKDAIFMKVFGISDKFNLLDGFRRMIKNGMQRMYYKYGHDIELIEDGEIKNIFKFVKEVMDCDDPLELEKIYNTCDTVYYLDSFRFEGLLKKEYMKLYNKELLQVEDLEQIDENMYDAGENFSIIATSIGAYVSNSPDDYKKDWNRPSLCSPHFCTNFIRNDMLGTAPVPHIMYGFSSMSEDSLVLAGPTDIHSTGQGLSSKAEVGEMYYGPNNMINESYKTHFKYNELDFKRIQNGEKKKPDYILVKKIDGIIANLEEAKKASAQWDNIPIVVIDVNKCLANEYRLLKDLISTYRIEPSKALLEQIIIKINNNRVTDAEFANDVNIEQLKSMLQEDVIGPKVFN